MPYKDPQHQKKYQSNRYQELKNDASDKNRRERCKKDLIERNRLIVEQARSRGCQICGYTKCKKALEFHHVDSSEKDAGIAKAIKLWGSKKLMQEIEKCVVLCANCHREVHDGLINIPN